ncbi:hypothetical protein, partial [Xanthomonas phaseoli]
AKNRGSERGHRDRYGLPHPPIALFRPSLAWRGLQFSQPTFADFIVAPQSGLIVAVMENPYDLPWVLIGIATGIFSGSLHTAGRFRLLIQMLVLALGTLLCWRLTSLSVAWSYEHPFNPNDGAARAVAHLFGWIVGLVFLILPSFFLTLLVRTSYVRRKRRGR